MFKPVSRTAKTRKTVHKASQNQQKIEPEIFREVKAGKVYSVRTILRRGEFEVNWFFAGRTLLHWASNNGNVKMFKSQIGGLALSRRKWTEMGPEWLPGLENRPP